MPRFLIEAPTNPNVFDELIAFIRDVDAKKL
jgi:hypothetical protein